MKKLLIIIVLLGLAFVPLVQAESVHSVAGAKLDMPNLIGVPQISEDLHLGIEASKDLATNIFYPDSFAGVEDDLGITVYAKVTFDGCIINCSK